MNIIQQHTSSRCEGNTGVCFPSSSQEDFFSVSMESDLDSSGSEELLDSDVADPELAPTAPMESLPPAMAQMTIKDDDGPVLVSSLDVGSSLLSALECPVCFDYMVPPIRLCSNGHNLCSRCQPKMECCPICREGFIPTRNIAMETIARELQYPCRNRKAGCDEKYPLQLINDHQTVCPRRLYPCMLSTDDPCEWKGRRHEILAHAREVHTTSVWIQEKLSVVYTNFDTSSNADVIDALDELFILHRRYDVEKQRLYAVVQFVGPTENAALYKYEFEFMVLGKLHSVVFRNQVHPDTTNINEIFESGNCVSLGFDVIVNFINDKELWCTVSVSSI